MDHALLSPSAAARNKACPGAARMVLRYPEDPTVDSMDGDAAHWACAEALRGQPVCVGLVAPNGVTLTDEMVDAADMWASHIFIRNCAQVGRVETLVKNDFFHVENYGTPDHYFYDRGLRRLYLDDFKFGHGYVSELRNWQLINYTGLVLEEMGVTGADDQSIMVEMTIVQPRNYHRNGPIRKVVRRASDMRADFNILRMAYADAMELDAPCIANDECENCPARWDCEAATAAGWGGVKVAYSSAPLNMSPQAMSRELRVLRQAQKRLKARITGLEEQVSSTIRRGGLVPGFKFEHGAGRTVWKDISGAKQIGRALGLNIEKEALITPLQAIKAGFPQSLLAEYAHSPGGAAELVEVEEGATSRIFQGE